MTPDQITSRLREKLRDSFSGSLSNDIAAALAPVVASMLEEETRELAKERDWYRGAWLKQTTAREQAEAETQALREALMSQDEIDDIDVMFGAIVSARNAVNGFDLLSAAKAFDKVKVMRERLAASSATPRCTLAENSPTCVTHDTPCDWVECTGWRCPESGQIIASATPRREP